MLTPLSVTDVEDVDNEKREMNESDIAGLYRFFSKNLDFPDHKELLTLFSQVPHTMTLCESQSKDDEHVHEQCFFLCPLFNRLLVMVSR